MFMPRKNATYFLIVSILVFFASLMQRFREWLGHWARPKLAEEKQTDGKP
jgi:hypothetical protein